ncbi:MAG: ABC transporter ATP-binding protein [Hyphomicrobiaceae bacterium]
MAGLRVEGIVRRYGSVTAVDHVSFTVAPGELVSLLGASGSGKTTTLRMIAGLEPVDAGRIVIGDTLVDGPGVAVPTARRRIGMVFQSYAVWPHMTVAQNVAFPLEQQRIARTEQHRRVAGMLARVELADLAERYPSQLSGGQQQRVALARALVAEPSVILFDEPLSNLDARLRDSMRGLIQSLHRQLGLTAIYVTHDQAEAMALSDRILLLDRGAIVQDGTPRSLYQQPSSLFVAEFLGQANTLPIARWDRQRNVAVLDGGIELHSVAPAASVQGRTPQHLIVRPHGVQLAGTTIAPDAVNTLPARVLQVTFLGDRVRCQLMLADTIPLTAEVPALGELPVEGGEIAVTLLPEQCLAI